MCSCSPGGIHPASGRQSPAAFLKKLPPEYFKDLAKNAHYAEFKTEDIFFGKVNRQIASS